MKTNELPARLNLRVLTIGDAESIHDDIIESLAAEESAELSPSAEVAAAIFGDAVAGPLGKEVFQVESAFLGDEAISRVRDSVEQCSPFAVVFVDMDMTSGDDVPALIERLWGNDSDLHIVTCATFTPNYLDQLAQRAGTTDRLLPLRKPLDPTEIRLLATTMSEKWTVMRQARQQIIGLEEWAVDARRVLNIIQQSHDELESAHLTTKKRVSLLANLVQERTAETSATRDVAVLALAKLAASRDRDTGRHLERMRDYSQVLAEHLAIEGPYTNLIDQDFLNDLHRSSPLHDIGKVGISDSILRKPGPLTPKEFDVMKEHTRIGAKAICQAAEQSEHGDFLGMASEIAMHHHERFDGTGYPDGLAGHAIPLAARIIALADVFDAITSARVYKEAASPETAHALILEQRGLQFDPAIIDAFEACYGQFLDIHSGQYAGASSNRESPSIADISVAPAMS